MPLIGVDMPMRFMHRAAIEFQDHSGQGRRDRKFLGGGHMQGTSRRAESRLLRHQRITMCSLAIQSSRRTRLRAIQRQYFSLHDVGLGLGNLEESFRRNAQGLRKYRRIVTAHPVADAERAMLRIETIVKRQNGVTW